MQAERISLCALLLKHKSSGDYRVLFRLSPLWILKTFPSDADREVTKVCFSFFFFPQRITPGPLVCRPNQVANQALTHVSHEAGLDRCWLRFEVKALGKQEGPPTPALSTCS